MKGKASSGHDGISSKLIKILSASLSYPISIIINKSIESGIVPNIFKLAKVIAIYKGKEKNNMSNYRPISLLPSMSKILEKVVHKRLYHFLNSKNVLSSEQYGFTPKHSTTDAIAYFTAHVHKNLDNNHTTLSVFLDLSKAFDTIDHKILLTKLEYYGVRGTALEWFRNYLSNRTQYVSYHGINSTHHNVTCGVPQGSVLGPLLFIIYTNDLPNSLYYSNCILFADDTTVYHSSSNISSLCSNIEYDLNILSDWFAANKLSLNAQKTNFVIFSPKAIVKATNSVNSLNLDTQKIHRVSCVKFLGVHIDQNLEWNDHIEHVIKKISCGTYAINSAKRTLSRSNLKLLYYSLVHPYIEYGLLVWGCAAKHRFKKIEIIQKKCIRNICKANYNEHTGPLYKSLYILKVSDVYNMHLCRFMYQFVCGTLPASLLGLFQNNRNIHSHITRQYYDPHVMSRKSNRISKTFLHQSPRIWATLPSEIKLKRTIKSFNYNMKAYLMKDY
jgi:hypothetical protein